MGGTPSYLAAAELRRRWRATVLLALLVALVVGSVLTCVAGARRTGSAVDRYLRQYQPMDVMVFGAEREQLEDLAAVETFASGEVVAAFPADVDGFFPMVAFPDGTIPYERHRPPRLEGRMAGPEAPFEVALGERTSRILGAGVGDRVPMLSFTPEETERFAEGDEEVEPTGPRFDLEVVGIVRDPGDITSRERDLTITVLSPAFTTQFDGQIGAIDQLTMVDLAPGATEAALADAGLEIDPAFSGDVVRRQAEPATSALHIGLLALAVAIAIAGVVAVGQAVARVAQGAASEDEALQALGCTWRDRASRVVAPGAVAIGVGTVLGVAGSVVASPLHPIGIARRAEIDPGFAVDPIVLLLGTAIALLLGALLLAGVAHRVLRMRVEPAGRTSTIVGAASRAGAPPAVVSGLQLAQGDGHRGAPVRTAAVAAFAGSLGIVAAVVFAASLGRLGSTPELYGWGWDMQVAGAGTSQVDDDALAAEDLFRDEDLAAVAQVGFAIPISVDGVPMQTIAIDDGTGDIGPIMVRGQAPVGPDEIALGGDSFERVGAAIGDEVEVTHEGDPRRFEVVGVVALPVPEDGGLSAEGAVMTWEAAREVGWSGECGGDGSCYRNYVLRLARGVDPDVIDERYSSEIVAVDRPVAPSEVQQVQVVDRLPWLLAALLAGLAVVAVGHAAWATVRHRRRDLTVLRCLGFTGAQLRTAVAVQVAVLVVAGSVLGVLAGVVVGRALWSEVVDWLSLPFSPAVPWTAVLVVPLATLVLAELVATVPRRAASRLRAADALRVE